MKIEKEHAFNKYYKYINLFKPYKKKTYIRLGVREYHTSGCASVNSF